MRTRLLLLSSLPVEGNGNTTTVTPPPTTEPPATEAQPSSAPRPVAPPPAASVVLSGDKGEGALAEDIAKRKLETRVAELEDERRRLLDAQSVNPHKVAATAQKKSWLEGGSFFD